MHGRFASNYLSWNPYSKKNIPKTRLGGTHSEGEKASVLVESTTSVFRGSTYFSELCANGEPNLLDVHFSTAMLGY